VGLVLSHHGLQLLELSRRQIPLQIRSAVFPQVPPTVPPSSSPLQEIPAVELLFPPPIVRDESGHQSINLTKYSMRVRVQEELKD
jgi:hypothetical protein